MKQFILSAVGWVFIAILCALCVYFFIHNFNYPAPVFGLPQHAYLAPAGVILLICGGIVAWRAFHKKHR